MRTETAEAHASDPSVGATTDMPLTWHQINWRHAERTVRRLQTRIAQATQEGNLTRPFRRGKTYGTILVDLKTNRPIDLLPERTGDALADWLREHPGVKLISRDRSSEYARGASEGAPDAQQIVDRWHVLKNLGEVVLRVVGRTHAALKQRQAASGVQVRPRYKKLRSSSELAASQVARLRRQARYDEVVTLYQQGKSIAAIVEQLHLSPTTVRKYVYAGAFPERATHFRRKGQLGSYLPNPEQRVRDQGSLNEQEQRMLTFIRQERTIEVAYDLVQQFVTIVRSRQQDQLLTKSYDVQYN